MFSFPRKIFIVIFLSASAFALDRNAFTFTKYDIELRVDPDEQAVAARGKITLRNDSDKLQTNLVLQVSSTFEFRMIELDGKPLQYVAEPQTTDIDHTGKVTEAVVTLPAAVPPQGSVELDVGYSGTIPRDSTRLTRREVPEVQALASDWDRVGQEVTVVRGIGHVIWYPIAVNPANLSDNTLFPTIAEWQARAAQSTMKARFCWITDEDRSYNVVSNGDFEGIGGGTGGGEGNRTGCASFSFGLQHTIPSFAIAPFEMLTRPSVSVYFLNGHDQQANDYAQAVEKVQPLVEEWFGKPSEKIQVIELPEGNDAPFDSGTTLFTPLNTLYKRQVEATVVHQLAHAAFHSPRPWISEGLATFAPFLWHERQEGRRAALDSLIANLPALVAAEKQNPGAAKSSGDAAASLLATSDDIYIREKAMFVWSMLRDMIGETAFKAVLKNYRAVDDKEPTYLQKLVAAQTKRDLEWFFDDWIYRDRGLPEFKIESAVPRETLNSSNVVAVTVENIGSAGAEIPITVRGPNIEQTQRVLVPAHQKVTTRLSVPGKPTEVILNDGSVPETDTSNDRMELK